MKKLVLILTLVIVSAGILIAQPADEEIENAFKEQRRIVMELKGLDDINTKMTINRSVVPESPDAAYFGIYVEDLTFPKAQELGYKQTYGVLVTGIVPNSPAWEYRLQEDDIIMTLAGKEATNYAAFEKIRKSLRAGDVINLSIFRGGQTISLDMTMGSRSQPDVSGLPKVPTKKTLSRGYGGGTWVPMWFHIDMTDVNDLVSDANIGFDKFRDTGVLQQGIGGKLPVGKGFFIGGQVTNFEDVKKTDNPTPGSDYSIWLRYNNTLGGVTLDKRIPLTKDLITSLGLLIGGGSHELEFINSNAAYDWNTLPGTISNSNNTHFLISKSYLVAQPRAEVMYRLLGWLGLRAEVGYTYGLPLTEDWRVRGMSGETFGVKNSPKTPFEGFNFTVGPWFGF